MLTILLAEDQNAASGMLQFLFALVGVSILLLMLRRMQMRKPKASSPRQAAHNQVADIRDQQRMHTAVDDMLVQLEEASRRVGADLDTRFMKLEAVIRDADERIARLEELSSGAPARTDHPKPSAPARPAPTVTIKGATLPKSNGRDAATAAPVTTPTPAKRPVTPRSEQPPGVDARYTSVCQMIDGGATAIETAEKLGLPLGEVELIINLRNYER